MSALCGVWLKGEGSNGKKVTSMLTALNHWDADDQQYLNIGAAEFGHLLLRPSEQSATPNQITFNADRTLMITADVRLDNTMTLHNQLGIEIKEEQSEAQIILRAYQKWGEDCVDHILGDFVFAIYDHINQKIFCSRDHMGIKSMYFYFHQGVFAFASEIKGILSLEDLNRESNPDWLTDYLIKLTPDHSSTSYKYIKKLPPAHTLTVDLEQKVIRRYWDLTNTQSPDCTDEESWLQYLHQTFKEAVSSRISDQYQNGFELSGGIDSSSIIAMAHHILGQSDDNIFTFTNIMDDHNKEQVFPFRDLRDDSTQVINHLNLRNSHFCSGIETPILDLIERNAKFIDEPSVSFSGYYYDSIYEQARQNGIRTMVSGIGGDHYITNRGQVYLNSLWSQNQHWQLLREHIKRKDVDFLQRIKEYINFIIQNFSFLSQLKSKFYNGRSKPMGYYRLKGIQESVIQEYELTKRISKYKGSHHAASFKEYHKYISNHPRPTVALEINEQLTRHYKIEYRYPMLDTRLVTLAFHMPDELKYKNGRNRLLFRKMMSAYLPESIIYNYRKERIFNTPSIVQRIIKSQKELGHLVDDLSKDQKLQHYVNFNYLKDIIENFDHSLKDYTIAQLNFVIQVIILSKYDKLTG